MSYEYNYKFWLATAKEIADIQLKEAAYIKLDIVTERLLAHDIFAEIYSRYVSLVNKLGYIFSRTFQVQKREIIEKLLRAASNRLIELRNELKNIEMSEFIYLDKTLIQKKLIPNDILLLNPPYFPYWRSREIERILYGPRIIETVIELTAEEEEARRRAARRPHATNKNDEIILTPEQKQHLDSIKMIQSHERARTSRVLLTNIIYHPEIYTPKPRKLDSINYIFTHKPDQIMLIPIKITRFDANYYVDRRTGDQFQYYVKPVQKQKVNENYDDEDLAKDQEASIFSLTDLVKPKPYIEKQIIDRTPYNVEPYFMMGMFDMEQPIEQYEIKIIKTPSEMFRNQYIFRHNLAAKRIQKQWHTYKENKLQKNRELFEKKLLGMASDRIVRKNPLKELFQRSDIQRTKIERFREEFQQAIEDERNRIVRVKSPWIMEDISDQIRAWFREFYKGCGEFYPYPDAEKGGTILLVTGETLDVQEYVVEKNKPKLSKEEKKKLRDKIKADKRKEKEKLMKLKRAEAKVRANNLARGGVYYNVKQEFPQNPNLSTIKETMDKYNDEWRFVDEKNNAYEDPFMEWIKADLFAEIHRELRGVVDELMRDSVPSMGEVREIFREWILGMGPLDLKKPKSILIAGPCGKHKLCDILASEINAVVIDLSPENVVRYENDLPYLINLVNKMARLFQPTIILINEVHRVFWKKIPKELKDLKPQLLSTILFKQIVKPIKSDERIYVLGTTSEPWAAKGKMAKAFEKILLLPKTDYASSFILWRTMALKYLGVPRDYEFSPLALVTKDYTSGNIVNNLEKTIDISRRIKFSRKPLKSEEFIETFLTIPQFPPDEKETLAYTKWFNKTNKLAKQRVKYMKKLELMKKKK